MENYNIDNDIQLNEIESEDSIKPAVIKVIGVGGGGNNAVNRMVNEKIKGVDFIVANTDAQVLATSKAEKLILLGRKTTSGLGAGADPEVGKIAAQESEKEIREALEGADLIFVAAGMGGGTGTGAAPIIAKIAQESGALVIAIVTKPFRFEGRHRARFADEGLEKLKKNVDSIIVISNDKVLSTIGTMPIKDSFREADDILKQGVQTITDLIAVPALMNLDFADVRTIMTKKGNALFGRGTSTGPNKAIEAANSAINSALLEASIVGAKDVIINITGGDDVSLTDAYDVAEVIEEASQNPDINIVYGIAINDEIKDDRIFVTVIATGFEDITEETIKSRSNVNLDLIRQSNKQSNQNNNVIIESEITSDLATTDVEEDFPTFLRRD
ncbi:cell division protein FtsZ [Mesoplasma photuris]|uniref:cell division protein FtsZ n=1 Tax=Mesoplasma photuris TaxID=217731 RepID=UPI00069151B0|nr:cell division protein FtsZ [Mesoplasma photuris]